MKTYFKRQTDGTAHEKTWNCLQMGNLKRQRESLLTAAQNNAVRTNYIKGKINYTQQNSEYKLCGEKDEMISHIISDYSRQAQNKYKTRLDWVGKVIYKEFWKKLKFESTSNWHMYNRESVQNDETHESFGILRYKLIP